MYQNTMVLPLPLSIHYPSHRSSSSLSNHFYHTRWDLISREIISTFRKKIFLHRDQRLIENLFFLLFLHSYYHPTSRPYQRIDEPILASPPYCIRRSRIKRRSIGPTIVYPSYRIHPIMTTEASIGVPSPLCSVCGDISTGKFSLYLFSHSVVLFFQEFILVEIVAKAVKLFSVDLFNVYVFRIINALMKVPVYSFSLSFRCTF